MASPTHLDSNSEPNALHEESAFEMQWQPTDTTSLQPANLSLTRAPRAWERKPLSPFSRQKMRVGKVWKRAAPVEIRQRRSVGGAGGKMVKKMRLDDGGTVAVARWEGEGESEGGTLGSPVRKIVLRRDRVGDEGLAALSDEDDAAVEGLGVPENATVEVYDEEGTLLHVEPEDAEEQQQWEDEELNPTVTHLGDVIGEAHQQTDSGARETVHGRDDGETSGQFSHSKSSETSTDSNQDAPVASTFDEATTVQSTTGTPGEVILPDGFVSPVKQQPVPRPRSVRKSFGSRRRTLPTEWKPSRLREVVNANDDEGEEEEVVKAPEEPVMALVKERSALTEPAKHSEITNEALDREIDQEWEDVEDGERIAELDAAMSDATVAIYTAESIDGLQSIRATESAPMDETLDSNADLSDGITESIIQPASPTKLPSSPVPSIEGQHPRLPLRRSPRRKSSSPVKQSATNSSMEKSHLVAFTPIKGPQRLPMSIDLPVPGDQSIEDDTEDAEPPLLERSVSAPPEEPKMSPQRPSRPRVSDDTALLQAFLNRAAETKSSGRRISATKRESISNRRDSDAVRQALASPAKPEVLADLDPNSPSPRKATIASDEIDDANILPDAETSPLHKTRRSGRATRKAAPQTATPAAAPSKISIRGNSDNVVLKKSEAQELSQLTRNNTRKNKGGAVLPLYRLAKLQQQGIVDPLDDGTEVTDEVASKPNGKGRALRWNETLVEFWQGGDVSETSLLSDELSSSAPHPFAAGGTVVDDEVPTSTAAPPPAETPSKPKIRRLKAPRTAATAGKATSAIAENAAKTDTVEAVEPSAPPAKALAPTKRRSRIATPAKGLGNSSLLPADLEPTLAPGQATAAPQQQKKVIPTPTTTTGRRKAAASKLPAPASAPTPSLSTSASALGQGKENNLTLTSSPPKKKAGAGTGLPPPSSKTFAPKLDFGKSIASLAPNTGSGSQCQDKEDGLPGLASPAKKVGRRGGVMFAPSVNGGGSQEEAKKEELPPGLRSPAKKRTRRAVGGY